MIKKFLTVGFLPSSSLNVPRLGGVRFGFWLTGKLGRAWDGAWVVHGVVRGWCMVVWWVCEGLDGDGEEVVGVVSCEMENKPTTPHHHAPPTHHAMHHSGTDPCTPQLAHQPKTKSDPS